MKRIYKFPLQIADTSIVKMHRDAEILSLQVQNEIPCIWAIVNPENPLEDYIFDIFGTGQGAELKAGKHRFVGTLQLNSGTCVVHVFYRGLK